MIGTAIVLVTYTGETPYKHRHIWMSEGYEYAPVELLDWQKSIESEQNCTLEILTWSLEERTDIGY